MNNRNQEASIKRELTIFLYKYRLRLTFTFLLILSLSVAASFIPTPKYTASSVLIVRLGSEYVYQPEAGNGGPAPLIPFSQEQIFKSEVAILGSYDLHEKVVREFGVGKLYPEIMKPKGALALYLKNMKEQSKEILKKVFPSAEKAKPKIVDKHKQLLARAVETFNKNFSILLEKESAVINISFEHPDPVLAAEALNKLLDLYFDKRKQLYLEPRAELARAEMQVTRDKALASTRAVDEYKRKHMIFSLTDQRAELLKRRSEAERQLNILVNPELERQIASINSALDELDAKEHVFNTMKREAESAQRTYDLYVSKFNEASSYDKTQRARADSVRIIQNPSTESEPKSLQLLIILAGTFLAVLATLLVAAITEFSRSGFLTPEHIERKLGIPVLAALPYRRRF